MAGPSSALYYPFIHFKDDNWLKLSALYWDSIGRIIPYNYLTEDSETALAFAEAELIDTLRPDWVRPSFSEAFTNFVITHADTLRQRYGLVRIDEWQEIPEWQRPPTAGGPSGSDPRLGYIFQEKITHELATVLRDTDIARPDPYDQRWVGMHPRLANVYMLALANQLALDRGLNPVTDESFDHVAVGGWSMSRLAEALLGDVELTSAARSEYEIETAAAYVAIRTVVPVNIEQVSAERILRFREDFQSERAAFREAVSDFVQNRAWLKDVHDPGVLVERLEEEYAGALGPKVDTLRQGLREAGIRSVFSTMSIAVTGETIATALASHVAGGIQPWIATGIVAGTALVPVYLNLYSGRREAWKQPEAYLLRLERELQPNQLVAWIQGQLQRFRHRS